MHTCIGILQRNTIEVQLAILKDYSLIDKYVYHNSLGEEPYSYGYGGTGRFSQNCKFGNYGEKFGQGDVIGALLDMDTQPPTISYMKNGQWLGIAHTLHGFTPGIKEKALFPHILTKNSRYL